jgi:hypothetical protein
MSFKPQLPDEILHPNLFEDNDLAVDEFLYRARTFENSQFPTSGIDWAL